MATRTATKKPAAKKTATKTLTAAQKKEVQNAVKGAPFLRQRERDAYLDALKKGIYVVGPELSDYAIESYQPDSFSPCRPDESLYDIKKNQFLAFEPGELSVGDVLDTLTYACENGRLNTRTWMKEAFKTKECFDWFIEEFAEYDECYRIYDRWWAALARLCEHEHVEEGFVRTDDIARCMVDWAEETGQTF